MLIVSTACAEHVVTPPLQVNLQDLTTWRQNPQIKDTKKYSCWKCACSHLICVRNWRFYEMQNNRKSCHNEQEWAKVASETWEEKPEFPETEEMLSSYLNERQQFCIQLKVVEISTYWIPSWSRLQEALYKQLLMCTKERYKCWYHSYDLKCFY